MDAAPHPLVARLVQQLLKRRLESFDDSTKQALAQRLIVDPPKDLQSAINKAPKDVKDADRQKRDGAINAILNKEDRLTAAERKGLANAVDYADIPDLVTIPGFLGGTVELPLRRQDAPWRILYLDSVLQSWRLIPDDEILLLKSVQDDKAPFGRRDVLWVDADTLTTRSEAPPRPEVQAQYLRGDFVRAGDLVAPALGGPSAASTGLFCEVSTPSCCTKKVRP
jgi:hypothetical protein